MNTKKHVLLICFCLIACLALDAQSGTGDRAKRRAENKANQRIDQKVDEAVDRAANKIEGLFRRKKTEEQVDTMETNVTEVDDEELEDENMDEEDNGGFLNGINYGSKFEPYENPVQMNVSMRYIHTNARGKETESVMHYTLDTWQTGIEVETDDNHLRMLMDNQEGSLTMVTTEEDEVSAFKMRQVVVDVDEVMPEESSYTITNLENNRVINDLNCTEYLIEHEEGTTHAWMTTDLEIDMHAFSRAHLTFARQSKNNTTTQNFAGAGFPIESTTVSKNGKETTVVQYYDINIGDDIDRSVFDIEGIKVMSIGF